jgi:hypothetical protein
LPTSVPVANLNTDALGARGFIISSTNKALEEIINLGDINGDSIDDFAINCENYYPYIIFGRNTYPFIDFLVENLSSDEGFYIRSSSYFNSIKIIPLGGDINGDGINDFIVTNYYVNMQRGAIYVFYGRNDNLFNPNIDNFSSDMGFRIFGANINNRIGLLSSGMKDITGDGIADILVNVNNAHKIYIIPGKKDGNHDITLDTSFVGATITGSALTTYSQKLGPIGDINGDGCEDYYLKTSDTTYIIFGCSNENNINLNTFIPSYGFKLTGYINNIIKVGDMNDDEVDDFGISSFNKACIIYGKKGAFFSVDLNNLSNQQGFCFQNSRFASQLAIYSISGGFDANKDGRSDLVILTKLANEYNIGYLIYGKQNADYNSALGSLKPADGIYITAFQRPYTKRNAIDIGDIDNDGFKDYAIATRVEVTGIGSGRIDIITNIFGSMTRFPTFSPAITFGPSLLPTFRPSRVPSIIPSVKPSSSPTENPTENPTGNTTGIPTSDPSGVPSYAPNLTPRPTAPTANPSFKPSKFPSFRPSKEPTYLPSVSPSIRPTALPSKKPSLFPTTLKPSFIPSLRPTNKPSLSPTNKLSLSPTVDPYQNIKSSVIRKEGYYRGTTENDIFTVKSAGDVVMLGNGGEDGYILYPSENNRLIVRDFNISSDVIDISNFNYIKTIEDLSISQGSTIINFANNQKVILSNINSKEITADNFIFHESNNEEDSSLPTVLIVVGAVTFFMVLIAASVCLYYNFADNSNKISPEAPSSAQSNPTPSAQEYPFVFSSHQVNPASSVEIRGVEEVLKERGALSEGINQKVVGLLEIEDIL